MPLKDYGVLLGTKSKYYRDQPNNFGKYFHGHIDVQTPGQLYNTAIDVDSQRPDVNVQWRVLHLRISEWQPIFDLPDRFHRLKSDETTGAVDYYRDPRLRNLIIVPEYVDGPIPWWKSTVETWRELGHQTLETMLQPAMQLMGRKFRVVDVTPPWKTGTDNEALTDLEAMLVDAPRVVIFGEFYPAHNGRPPGLHDIHLNQGDPINSPFSTSNSIWQDGLTIAIHSDGNASAFMNKFSTQAMNTDDQGHPI